MAPLIAGAPRITDHLCDACASHFAAVRAHLDAMGIAYRLEPTLVRGLDYYTRTTFEFYRPGAEGQQQALGGGGRYDGLIELLGGKPTPGIGFALGLDRVVLALAAVHGAARRRRVERAAGGRGRGRPRPTRSAGCGSPPSCAAPAWPCGPSSTQRKLGRQLEAAVREGARFAMILGDELADGEVQLRDLGAASQKVVELNDLATLLRRKVRA